MKSNEEIKHSKKSSIKSQKISSKNASMKSETSKRVVNPS